MQPGRLFSHFVIVFILFTQRLLRLWPHLSSGTAEGRTEWTTGENGTGGTSFSSLI